MANHSHRQGAGRTGPRTEAGKARSSRNAVKHGLSARRDTPEALARHTEAALGIIAGLAAGRGLDPMSRDAALDFLEQKGRIGMHALSVVLPYVAADEQVQRASRAKREALLAAEGLLAFDALLPKSYADIAVAIDRHADEGLDRRAVIDVQAERAMEEIASLSRTARRARRGGKDLGDFPFGSPTQPGMVERLGATSAATLHALQEIARLDRYEARAFGARGMALRRLRHLEILLSPVPDGSEGEGEEEVEEELNEEVKEEVEVGDEVDVGDEIEKGGQVEGRVDREASAIKDTSPERCQEGTA